MYHPIEIKHLSANQISKVLNGHPVRVLHGKGHQIEVSHEQLKKMHKAHSQGKGINITFDPFQQANHQHLRGQGIMSSAKRYAQPLLDRGVRYANEINDRIKRVTGGRVRKSRKHGSGFLDVINDIGHKAGSVFSAGNNIPFNPYDLGFQLGHDVIAPELMKGHGMHRHHKLKHGRGFFDDVGHALQSPAVKSIAHALQPLAEKALSKAGDYAIDRAMSGEGMHRHHKKRVGRPRKIRAGALYASGYSHA